MTARRDTSADSAARFLASRERKPAPYRRPAQPVRRLISSDTAAWLAVQRSDQPRIACDFAEPTLRLIHEVLIDAIHAGLTFGDRGALLLIAEQMVATALGDPPCDDPPLSDRGVP